MKSLLATLAASLLALPIAFGLADARPLAPARAAPPAKLRGDYIEARTCDVWVGACFANSETSEAGRYATLAWKFAEGEWKGVKLDGTAAALVIAARSTIGDRFHSALPVHDVLLIDEKASSEQAKAIRDFVATQTGELGANVVEEKLVPITMKLDCCDKKGCAKLSCGELVKIETRCLHDEDKVCGHEDTYYPPLVGLAEKHAVYTLEHTFKGAKTTLLAIDWTDRDSRSAFLGKFELDAPPAPRTVDPDEVIAR